MLELILEDTPPVIFGIPVKLKYISTKSFQKFKQQARKLKKDSGLTHCEALDEIAKLNGFHHWKDVCNAYQRLKPTEDFFNGGCIFCIERGTKPLRHDDKRFIEDSFLLKHFCKKDLKEYYKNKDEYFISFQETKKVDIDKENYLEILSFYRVELKYLENLRGGFDIMELLTSNFNGLLFYWLKGEFTNTDDIYHYLDQIPTDFAFDYND